MNHVARDPVWRALGPNSGTVTFSTASGATTVTVHGVRVQYNRNPQPDRDLWWLVKTHMLPRIGLLDKFAHHTVASVWDLARDLIRAARPSGSAAGTWDFPRESTIEFTWSQ